MFWIEFIIPCLYYSFSVLPAFPITVKWTLSIQLLSQNLKVKAVQLCLTLYNPMDCIVRGILQARILVWVAFPFSTGSSQPGDLTQVSCIAGRFFTSWATGKSKNTEVCSLSLHQWIFRTQETKWVSSIAGGFFTNWAIREAKKKKKNQNLSVVLTSSLPFYLTDRQSIQAPLIFSQSVSCLALFLWHP